jgi:hypothetical protein
MLIIIMCYSVVAPVRIAFAGTSSLAFLRTSGGWEAIEALTLLLFLADIAINFNTAIKKERRYVYDRKIIVREYLKYSFIFDLVAVTPFLWFLSSESVLGILKLFKILRISKVYTELQFRSRTDPAKIRLLTLLLILVLMWHWIACGYWKISVYGGLCDAGDFYECVSYWAPTKDLLKLGFQTQYTQSFFWAVVVTTGIGRDIIPRTNIETGFTVMVIMVGVIMYALVIGAVGRSIAELDSTNTAFRKKLKELNLYMRYQNVPDYLQKTVLDYYDYLYESRNAVDHSVLEELPDSIQVRLSVAQNRGLIQTVPLFADCSTACVIRLVQKLVPLIALPGEFIIVEGEEGSEMFLVYKGTNVH